MTRIVLPNGTAIYLLTKDKDETDCDIQFLEELLDKTEEQIAIIRASLAIIKEHRHDHHIENPS